MIIRGILDRSLSNQICIRGFARIKELARISKANEAYQRQLVDTQEKVVSNFLTEENDMLFFPEVILSLRLQYDNTQPKAQTDLTPIQRIEQRGLFSSNVDSVKIRTAKKDYKSSFDVNGNNKIVNAEIEFDDVELSRLIQAGNQPLQRIDGNHRLSAAEQLNGDRIEQMNIPYCIVLFESITTEQFNHQTLRPEKVTSTKFEKFEKTVFNNINFKSLPLTKEQNLRVILDDESNFPDEEIEHLFGKSWVYTRRLLKRISIENFSGIEHLLRNNIRTYILNIIEYLLDDNYNEDKITDDVFESLKAVEQLYRNEETLQSNDSEGLFGTFIYYNIKDKIKYNFFKDWVIQNNISEIREAKKETIIQIFDKVSQQTICIFVAMPYYCDEEVASYNLAYLRVIEKLKAECPSLKIALYPIMQHKGETYNINNKMIEQINDCSIFVADISNRNINVAFELGYARSIRKPTIMVKRKSDTNRTPFDYEQDMCHSYNENAIQTLEDIIHDNVKVELQKKGFVFNS